MDLGGWLRSLGLEQYEAAFRENAIDEKLLPRLSAEDLKDLGVNLVGHRRQDLEGVSIQTRSLSENFPALLIGANMDYGLVNQFRGASR